jgi:hypothetical protein
VDCMIVKRLSLLTFHWLNGKYGRRRPKVRIILKSRTKCDMPLRLNNKSSVSSENKQLSDVT